MTDLVVRLPGEPRRPELADRGATIGRRDVLTAELAHLDGRGERLRVALGHESAPVGLAPVGRAVPDSVPLAGRGVVGADRSVERQSMQALGAGPERIVATSMRVVKMDHPIKYQPTATP